MFLGFVVDSLNLTTSLAAVRPVDLASEYRPVSLARLRAAAMSFAAEMSEFYDKAIEPAVRQAGYEPIRVDRREHANSIDDEIIGNIRKARFMGADFTGQRAGVYFEAGMMNGLGRTVVWMCDKRELERRVALRR